MGDVIFDFSYAYLQYMNAWEKKLQVNQVTAVSQSKAKG